MKKIKPEFDVETIRLSYRYNVKPKGMGTNSIARFITPGFTSSIADYKAWGIPTSRGRKSKSRRSKSKRSKRSKNPRETGVRRVGEIRHDVQPYK